MHTVLDGRLGELRTRANLAGDVKYARSLCTRRATAMDEDTKNLDAEVKDASLCSAAAAGNRT